jgi:hypothetical protein
VIFGKLFFAIAPFLNNSLILADIFFSGKNSTESYGCGLRIARTNLAGPE